MQKITINDVAKKSGVSKATVSAVINGKSSVKAETRDKVLAVMKELNFRPKGTARNIRNQENENCIGLIIKELDNPFYTNIAMAVKEYANQRGYLVIITSSENTHDFERRFSRFFADKDVKGAIIAPVMEQDAEIEHLFFLKQINFPFVLLENIKGIRADFVSIDNYVAMKKAVQYLISLGHSNIVHFSGPLNSSHSLERIEGFKLSFSESHLAFREEMIMTVGSRIEDGYQKTLDYLKHKKREEYPTALICFNDQQALGVLKALDALNIRVPDDISIIGNDDISVSQLDSVSLTTVHPPIKELGYKAAEILIDRIESKKVLPIQEVVLDTELKIRKSCRKI